MNDTNQLVSVACLSQVNGLPFGASVADLVTLMGAPDEALHNYTGEFEVRYGECFYRFFDDRFVEGTFPDRHRFVVDGVVVLSIFKWLSGLSDTVDKAKFRISLNRGIAYDYRNLEQGSITIFEAGRWDQLVLGPATLGKKT
jgi:hypothetical protein